jgi:hypothetical protein
MPQTRLAFLATVVIIDLAATVLLCSVTQVPMSALVTLAFFRPVVLFLAFGGVLLLTTLAEASTARFVGACVLFYLLFPFGLWALKPGSETASEVYFDLHTKADLFVVICLPFLLASSISVFLTAFRYHRTPASNA